MYEDAWLEEAYEDRQSGTFAVPLAEMDDAERSDLHYEYTPPDADEDDDDPCADGHDWQAEDIADGVVGGGAAHVFRVYCSRCDAEGEPEDLA